MTLAIAWAGLVAMIWARALRPRLTLAAQVVEIRAYGNDATIPLRDIAYCRAVPTGMQIGCVDGRVKLAPYPTKSWLAHRTGRRTDADAAAELIMARAEAARIESAPEDSRGEWWPF